MPGVLVVDNNPSNYGTTETLRCTDASYTSGNYYTWKKDDVTIFSQDGELSTTGKYSEIIDGNTFMLVINNIDVRDEGSYTANHAFADSNTIDLKVESRGTITAKLLSSNILEVTFKEIYPEKISAVITCDNNTVAGSFVSSVADGDRFKKTWQSAETFTSVPKNCSANMTLRTTFNTLFDVTKAPDEASNEEKKSKCGEGCIAGSTIGSVGVGVYLAGLGLGIYFNKKNKGKIDQADTLRDVESTKSSPKKAKNKLLHERKQSSATGKPDGMKKGKQVSDTQTHPNGKSQKVHPEREGRRLLSPTPGANLNPREGTGRDVEMQETDNSLIKSQLPDIHYKKGSGL